MKNIILILILLISFSSCYSQSTNQNDTRTKSNSLVKNTKAKIDVHVSAEDINKVKEITMKLLNQNNAYLVSRFYFKDRIYWLALEKKTMSKIFFYANRDFTNIKFINKKKVGYKYAYSYYVENNIVGF